MDVRGFEPVGPRFGHNQILRPARREGINDAMRSFGQTPLSGSAAWPLANLAFYIPISIVEPFTVVEVAWENGTGASAGDVDLGIYDDAFARIGSLGATARGAASTLITTTTQTDYTIAAPGVYYLAMSHSATNNIFGWVPIVGICQAMGIMEETSAHPLPATATPVITTRAYFPDCMFLVRSTAL